ncbi:hypothetical protein JIP1600_3580004 [Flavobacterium psychrophilum]|nr:hypothetical protein JIP1600_3580004 [Flavobacterium psychrophilum]
MADILEKRTRIENKLKKNSGEWSKTVGENGLNLVPKQWR